MRDFVHRLGLAGLFLATGGSLACVGDNPINAGAPENGAGAPATDAAGVDDAPSNTKPGPGDGGGIDPSNAPPGAPSNVAAAAVPVVSTVTTLAGLAAGFLDGTGAAAKFFEPHGLAVDALGNVYVADTANRRIRKVSSAGVVTTLAGTGASTPFVDGPAATATFSTPLGVAVHTSGVVYVADGGNNRVRKLNTTGGVSTLAGAAPGAFLDGNGAAARFFGLGGIAVDNASNVYVADTVNHRIRLVSAGGDVITLAGSGAADFANGTGAAASFRFPSAVATASGSVWVADSSNHRIRRVTAGGVVTTMAGSDTFAPLVDGTGAAATFNAPHGVALDADGNAFIADQNNHRIRKMSPAGVVTTFAGSGQATFADGPAATAAFNSPYGIAVDAAQNVYVGDSNNHRIRKITSVGIRQLTVKWNAPGSSGSSTITGYEATATAVGQTPKTCTTTGALTCTISELTSDVAYSVSVVATNAAGTSPISTAVTATPN